MVQLYEFPVRPREPIAVVQNPASGEPGSRARKPAGIDRRDGHHGPTGRFGPIAGDSSWQDEIASVSCEYPASDHVNGFTHWASPRRRISRSSGGPSTPNPIWQQTQQRVMVVGLAFILAMLLDYFGL